MLTPSCHMQCMLSLLRVRKPRGGRDCSRSPPVVLSPQLSFANQLYTRGGHRALSVATAMLALATIAVAVVAAPAAASSAGAASTMASCGNRATFSITQDGGTNFEAEVHVARMQPGKRIELDFGTNAVRVRPESVSGATLVVASSSPSSDTAPTLEGGVAKPSNPLFRISSAADSSSKPARSKAAAAAAAVHGRRSGTGRARAASCARTHALHRAFEFTRGSRICTAAE